jgi:hypothetical protein
LFMASIGLGLALGIRQFWMEHIQRNWSFLIHRSVDKGMVLTCKLAASIIAFVVSLGFIWYAFYSYSRNMQLFGLPPTPDILYQGWFLIIFGFVVYLGIALSGLYRKRWYATKLLPLLFVFYIFVAVISSFSLTWSFVHLLIGIAILLPLVIDAFLTREF